MGQSEQKAHEQQIVVSYSYAGSRLACAVNMIYDLPDCRRFADYDSAP
ncbi:MAG: hypothetical protein KDE47_27145 [Caldilineaceae bacterium]|nr:hypothetical protein [Caldilineaceae bacterium]